MNAPGPNWLYVANLRLAAVSTAAGVARMFVRQHLQYLGFVELVGDAELVMSELVANAVAATGIADPEVKLREIGGEHLIGVQLRAVDTRFYIEVWDRSTEPPVKQTADDESEHGRGLVLIEAVAERWGVVHPLAGGKVVWGELVLVKPPYRLQDRPPLPQWVSGAAAPPPGPVLGRASVALLARVQDGLRRE